MYTNLLICVSLHSNDSTMEESFGYSIWGEHNTITPSTVVHFIHWYCHSVQRLTAAGKEHQVMWVSLLHHLSYPSLQMFPSNTPPVMIVKPCQLSFSPLADNKQATIKYKGSPVFNAMFNWTLSSYHQNTLIIHTCMCTCTNLWVTELFALYCYKR